jgi:BON domain-containing protein
VLQIVAKVDSLLGMGKAPLRWGNRTFDGLKTFDQARGALAQRLDDIDMEAMRKRGSILAGLVRSDLQRRMRPERRRPSPGAMLGIAGLAMLGLAAAGVGYVISNRERREWALKRRDVARKRMEEMRSGVRERYAELTSGRTRAEAELEERVEKAVSEGGKTPEGLETVVEGRTVYLRGAVADPASVDAAAERAHGVPGVVAVVNLTTSRSGDQRTPANAAKS